MTIAELVVTPAVGISLAGISMLIGFLVTYNKHNKDKVAEGVEKGKFEQFVLGKLDDIIEAQKIGADFDKNQERINSDVNVELILLRKEIESYVSSNRKEGE